jgi:UDP-3-O-[3-hydroxymyristoyl] glucosamine N-acyltransferase
MIILNRPVSCAEIMQRLPDLFTEVLGDPQRQFNRVAAPETAVAGDACFLATPKSLAFGLSCPAQTIIVSPKLKARVEGEAKNRTILISPQVDLAMARVISEFFIKTPYTNASIQNVHPSAVVARDAELGDGVRIGPNAFIGAKVKLGRNVYVGACSVIEDETEIGDDTVIHPQVFIGHSTLIGKRCEVHPHSTIGKEGFGYAHNAQWQHFRIPHQGRVVLEDDVHIGSSCTIDRATFQETRLGSHLKMDNQIHIAHNCTIGKNAILTGGFAMAGSSKIGINFLAGGRSLVGDHVEIADNVQIAGLAGVARSIKAPGAYGGYPLQPLQQFLRTKSAILKLNSMKRQLAKISKHLGLEDTEEVVPSESTDEQA